ncbi:MAG: hypothetical protein C4567_07705 [Deltaproteobacteria bacterium]|nr:MAG: hypothetical protein C4567_07705 [Deltaproteobacteria bacterium]
MKRKKEPSRKGAKTQSKAQKIILEFIGIVGRPSLAALVMAGMEGYDFYIWNQPFAPKTPPSP